ncbi:MAG: hypothetical protein IH613_08660 [Desulfuromonadales bacterium]|nr:hypothetical protein [Desulfuromonadales bacterium]
MKEQIIKVKTEEFPIKVIVLGADGKESTYKMIATRKNKGAQLCAAN